MNASGTATLSTATLSTATPSAAIRSTATLGAATLSTATLNAATLSGATTSPATPNSATQVVPIQSLLPADSPRLVGEDVAHTRLLAQTDTTLPPILVHRDSMRVIDGVHRVCAARLRGCDAIEVQFFDGTEADAFVLAVKENVTHGLPLSRADREAAARRIIGSHPQWSDRAIAVATGLSGATVAGIRRTCGHNGQPDARIGRDGRVRPLNAAAGRRLASQVIADQPGSSLRQIARAAGISVATARDVRNRLHRGEDPVPLKQRGAAVERSRRPAGAGPAGFPARAGVVANNPPIERDRAGVLQNLRTDPSLRFVENGRMLLRWLHAHSAELGEWRSFVAQTPPHCAYTIARLARGCAAEWLDFAGQLERRLGAMEGDVDVA